MELWGRFCFWHGNANTLCSICHSYQLLMCAFIMYIVHCHIRVLLTSHPGGSVVVHTCARAHRRALSATVTACWEPLISVLCQRAQLCAPSEFPHRAPGALAGSCLFAAAVRPAPHRTQLPALPVRPIRLWPTRKAAPGLPFYCSVMKESERDLGTRPRISQWACWCGQRFCHRHDDLWRRFSVEGSARG